MSRQHKYLCIHGHFYQPPRENAWLEIIEQQESARPWHDWNARINFECYAPNGAARILGEDGLIKRIRNNYSRISFNFGPTLLTWMQSADPEAYDLMLEGDRLSLERYGGHGNALAQVHSHLIMPLCNARDKVTQVYWGVRDFEYRFKRYPEGIWLAETAVDMATLEVVASHGLLFTILAPGQAKAVRKLGSIAWQTVSADTIDTRRPYWCTLPSGRRIALFFYHGGVAQDVAFNHLLNNGRTFAHRLLSVFDEKDKNPQLAHIATDGESYGHHHRYGEMALADAVHYIEENDLATMTNYGQYLELFPPENEVQIHENSSWSCVHGVERWRDNCGCNTGGHPGWHQRWRKPLRETLNWLRDKLIPLYEHRAAQLLRDPWAARNDYIEVILRRSPAATDEFLKKHARRVLSPQEETQVLRLLELQRHAMLMFTSCGWFFDEISGIETNQILQYALRAMDYAQDVFGESFHKEFTDRLAAAPSNKYPNGAVSYQQNVITTSVDLERVATHFAVASLFEPDPSQLDLYNYYAEVEFFERLVAGTPMFVVGRLQIRSKLTRAAKMYNYAVLYLGQQHIIGNISSIMNRATFDIMYERSSAAFNNAEMGDLIGILQEYFGPTKFTLTSLLADEKINYIRAITSSSLQLAESNFRNVFNDNYQLITGLVKTDLPLPEAWRSVSTYVLNADLVHFFENGAIHNTQTLRRIADDLKRWNIPLTDEETIRHSIGLRLDREIDMLDTNETSLPRLQWLNSVMAILNDMQIKPDLWKSQNRFYRLTKGYRKGAWVFSNDDWQVAFERLAAQLRVRVYKEEEIEA
jgi:alpha-amylase/alpha-mannosidase (GH57 family)